MPNPYDDVTEEIEAHNHHVHMYCGCRAISPAKSDKWLLYENDLCCNIHDQEDAVNEVERDVDNWNDFRG